MKKILITGSDSYIGTNVEKWLLKTKDKYEIDTIDMKDNNWIKHNFSRYDVVFHVAGIAHISNKKKLAPLYFKVNRDLAIKTAKKAKKEGVKQFIFMSSMIIYGKDNRVGLFQHVDKEKFAPINAYGQSKLEADLKIQGYKNIEKLDYVIQNNKVNVLIGISGSGKSSIAGALLEEDVERNQKINYTGEVISGIEGIENPKISVFDEKLLDKYLFAQQKDDNVYSVLIDNENEYVNARIHLENRLTEINKLLILENDKYLELKKLQGHLGGTLTNSNKLRATSTIIKAKKSLDAIGRSNVYSYLNALTPKHADWVVAGVEYIDEEKKLCPFCTKKLNKKKINIINKIDNVDLKSRLKINQTVESFDEYLSSTPFTLKGINQLEEQMLEISIALKEFEKLKNDIFELYDIELTLEDISFDYEKELFKIFPSLEVPLKALNRRKVSLKRNFDKANANTKNIFSRRLNAINNVIESMGIPYKIEAKYKRSRIYGYKLFHVEDKNKEERMDGLSTGERKIISLIFFALEQQNKDSDLIIFDDPVSSYDENRRYSLYRYITETLRDKTILILSHDQLFAKFAVYDKRRIVGDVSYFENAEDINLIKIVKEDFNNINYYIKERIQKAESYMQKIINLRYFYELSRKQNIYTYITKVFKKEDVISWLQSKALKEESLLKIINNELGIVLEPFNSNFYDDVNIEDLSVMEKVFILRQMDTSKTLKDELSNYVHLSSKFVITLNPYKFSFASNYVIKAIQDNLDSTHTF